MTFSSGTTRRNPVVGLTALGMKRLQWGPADVPTPPGTFAVTKPSPHVPGDGNSTIATLPKEAGPDEPRRSSAICRSVA